MAGGRVDILVNPDFTGFGGKLRGGLAGATGAAGSAGRLIGTAIAGGTAIAAIGFKKVIDIGIQYQDSLNTLQAVTGATAQQMKLVGSTAQALGADLSLPATSAADAAAAMTELAKGGFTVSESMTAAKGTLQLAAAAQIDAASAAEIQVNALNAFNLTAADSGRVADVLANTANSATGEITDIAQAFKAVGPVANQFGISIEDTATTLGLFANAGIQGSDSGTLLKSTLLALASPSKQAAGALRTLGVDAFDAKGNFEGMPALLGQLTAASKRLTPEQYAAAASIAFGSDAARTAGIAAGLSAEDWDKMRAAVGKAGGASDVAAAKSKGLGGAVEGLKSQLETVAIDIYGKVSPALEQFVRQGAEGIPKLEDAAGRLFEKLTPVGDGFKAVWESLKPIATGVKDIVTAGSGLGPVGTAATLFGGALKVAAAVIGPFASAAGGLLTLFSQLPGPIQTAASALLLLKVGPAILGGLFGGLRKTTTESGAAGRSMGLFGRTLSTVASPVTKVVGGLSTGARAIKSFGQEMAVQQKLAQGFGFNLSKLEAAQSAYQTSTLKSVTTTRNFTNTLNAIKASAAASGQPISTFTAATKALAEQGGSLGKIGTAFTSAAAGATRFKTLAGGTAAVGATVKAGLGGLVGFLGGPWGAALAIGGTALALLGQHQEEAAQKARDHQAALEALRGTLDTYSGAVTAATVSEKAGQLAKDGTLDKVKALQINTNDYVRAMLGEAPALQNVTTQLAAHTSSLIAASPAYRDNAAELGNLKLSLDDLTQAALGNPAAVDKVNEAVRNTAGTSLEAQQHYLELIGALKAAAEPATTLAKAIGLSVPEVQKLQHEQQLATEASRDFGTALQGIAPALAGLQPGVAASEQLQKSLDAMAESAKNAAKAEGEHALALGGNTVSAAEAARKKMQELRDQFVDTYVKQHEGSLTAQHDAEVLADSLGLIPEKAKLDFTTNASTVSAQVNDIVKQVGALPPGKTITIDAPTAEVQTALTKLGLKVEQIPGTKQVKVSVDTAAAEAKGQQIKKTLDSITALAKVDANIGPATAKGAQVKTLIDNITGILTVDGNPAPGTAKANQLRDYINALIGILTADANTDPGTEKSNQLKEYIDGLKALIPVDADTAAAEATVNSFINSYDGRKIQIDVLATGGLGRASGGIDAKGFKAGGLASMRRMSNIRADIIRPGQLRVIGDNMRYPEAFIPLNPRDRRARAIYEYVARIFEHHNGYRAYADGGIALRQMRDLSSSRLDLDLRGLASVLAGAQPARGSTAQSASSAPMTVNQYIAPPNAIGPAAVARESVFRMRHANRGVHSDR